MSRPSLRSSQHNGCRRPARFEILPVAFQKVVCDSLVGNQQDTTMRRKKEVQQGTLALMVLKTLDVLGPQHGYGLAKRIEQISADALAVNQGTLYPLLLKLEHE